MSERYKEKGSVPLLVGQEPLAFNPADSETKQSVPQYPETPPHSPPDIIGESGEVSSNPASQASAISKSQESQQKELIKVFASLGAALKPVNTFCANTNCNSKTDKLSIAPAGASVCIGIPAENVPSKICPKCLRKVETLQKRSKELVKGGGNLFSLKFETKPRHDVITLDQDDGEELEETQDNRRKSGHKRSNSGQEETYSVSARKLDKVLSDMMRDLKIKQQVEKCTQTLDEEINSLSSNFEELDEKLESTFKEVTHLVKMYNSTVDKSMPMEIGTLDIDPKTGRSVIKEVEDLSEQLESVGLTQLPPPVADFMKTCGVTEDTGSRKSAQAIRGRTAKTSAKVSPSPAPQFAFPRVGQYVHAMYKDLLAQWLPAKIRGIENPDSEDPIFEVEITCPPPQPLITRKLPKNRIAFSKPIAGVNLDVGTRVIARFKDLMGINSEWDGYLYSGVIIEPRGPANEDRYLVFFDDGYIHYASAENVIPVVFTRARVWKDLMEIGNVREFMAAYLRTYPNRSMYQGDLGDYCKVKIIEDGKEYWTMSSVIDSDCSLIKVKYDKKCTLDEEWLFRGSWRIYDVHKNLPMPTKKSWKVADEQTTTEKADVKCEFFGQFGSDLEIGSFAENRGKTFKIMIPRECPMPRAYSYHRCSPSCCLKYSEEQFRRVSPLVVPFYLGWAREFSKPSTKVSYVTPCGKSLSNYAEVHDYNTATQNGIPVEFFSFEPVIDCLNEFTPEIKLKNVEDISYGKEWTPVQCVNSISNELPPTINYSVRRVLGDGVKLSDEGFLSCCDCVDDCKDKTKCACWQLTLDGLSCKSKRVQGYEFRRLKYFVESGIFECNPGCKCSATTCFNRVAQGNVMWPMQIFKTSLKGWGVRALHDIPKGSFICNYVGKVLNDSGADQEGLEYGDEYLADLDYIEIMEAKKDGYESTCSDLEDDDLDKENQSHCDQIKEDPYEVERKFKRAQVARKSTGGHAVQNVCYDTDIKYSVPSSPGMDEKEDNEHKAPVTGSGRALRYRKYFAGKNKELTLPYTIDGKRVGNFGRFFNHSCDPNLFIQTVFVDTHDLRLPWVAFFTSKDVKAGTEMCWDYRYQVGSVEGRRLDCFCGHDKCRRRIL